MKVTLKNIEHINLPDEKTKKSLWVFCDEHEHTIIQTYSEKRPIQLENYLKS